MKSAYLLPNPCSNKITFSSLFLRLGASVEGDSAGTGRTRNLVAGFWHLAISSTYRYPRQMGFIYTFLMQLLEPGRPQGTQQDQERRLVGMKEPDGIPGEKGVYRAVPTSWLS